MNFASDNVYGVDPAIMDALAEANRGTAESYAADGRTKRVEQAFNEVFEREVKTFLVVTGTAANALALSTMTPPFGAIFAHEFAHINADECGAPELYSGGAKLIGLPGRGGKIASDMVGDVLKGFIRGEHDPKPAAISITQATELGSVYSVGEVEAFGAFAKARGLKLHMDGARFANALVSLDVSPADITWRAGVDALSFGATKNGAMGVEAVVFFDEALAQDFQYRRMRGGHLISKSRFLAAQMEAYLANDLWLTNARHANKMAEQLANGLAASGNARLALKAEANEVFAILSSSLYEKLEKSDAVFHRWIASGGDTAPVGEGEVMIRLVTSFQTAREDVDRFVALVAGRA